MIALIVFKPIKVAYETEIFQITLDIKTITFHVLGKFIISGIESGTISLVVSKAGFKN